MPWHMMLVQYGFSKLGGVLHEGSTDEAWIFSLTRDRRFSNLGYSIEHKSMID